MDQWLKKKIRRGAPLWVMLKTLSPSSLLAISAMARFKRDCLPGANKSFIVSSAVTGMCNRIKCLLSSMRLADMYSRRLFLRWPQNDACGCNFHDLFENSIPLVDDDIFCKMERRVWTDKDIALVYTWRMLSLSDELPSGFAREYPAANGKAIDFEYHRIPQGLLEAYTRIIRTLKPCSYIKREVERFAVIFNDNTVSINIRTWQGEKTQLAEARSNLLFKIENVYRLMDKCKNNTFFVCSDSERVIEEIVERYAGRVLTYPKRTFIGDRFSKEGCQDALIELLLLARNRTLKVSYASTFSEMAWWFGGCQADVEVIENRADIERYLPTFELVERTVRPEWLISPESDGEV